MVRAADLCRIKECKLSLLCKGGRSHTEDSKPSVFSWAVSLNEDFWVTRQQLTSFRIAHRETEACVESHPQPLAQERGTSIYFHFQANS